MNGGPTIIERQTLGNLLDVLKKEGNQEWKEFITSWFSDWSPISNSDISQYQYNKTLKNFPVNGKREIIRGVLLGWNKHHDSLTLYNCINSLIYLKVCDIVEYFFLQQFYNFLISFGKVCKNKEQIVVQPKNHSFYTIRFRKEGVYSEYGASIGIIDFQLPPIGKNDTFCIIPWNSLLSAKTGLKENEVLEEETLPSIIEEEIFPLLENESAKEHCHRIESSWDFCFRKEPLGRGVVITMHSLYYKDLNNGF